MSSHHHENSSFMNDFVHRDGFPALRLPKIAQRGESSDDKSPVSASGSSWNVDDDEPIPRYDFWGCRQALELPALDKLQDDCRVVFSARAKDNQEAYSAGVTYFCPSLMPPRCALEALALDIFRMHTRHLADGVMIPEQSGAEWWTLVLDDEENDTKVEGKKKPTHRGNDDKGDDDDDDDDEESDEVGLHFDADYGLEDQASGLLLHPRLATVTYLSDYGAPTVIFDKRSPPPTDTEQKSLGGNIVKGWLSRPATGKHIAFDGRLLHGAPATFFPAIPHATVSGSTDEPPLKKSKVDRVRYTFLVNIWINHCPLDAEPLDDDVCEKLTPVQSAERPLYTWKLALALDRPVECTMARLATHGDDAEPAGEEDFVLCNRLVTVKYDASMEDLHQAVAAGDLVELDIEPGALSLEVGEQLPDESDNDEDVKGE